MTTTTFASGAVEKPTMTFNGYGKSGAGLIGVGEISSNYNIFTVDAVFTGDDGKVVSSFRAYPYDLKWSVSSEIAIRKLYNSLPSGRTYTYTLTAAIGPGSKTVCSVTFRK